MTKKREDVRILALVKAAMQGDISHQLEPLGMTLVFINSAAEFSHLARNRETYNVALLPAVLPDSGWWTLWGEIALLDRRPEILVYAHSAGFQLWSGVLEAGGYDVIVEPFTAEELQGAVLRAVDSFEQRCLNENE